MQAIEEKNTKPIIDKVWIMYKPLEEIEIPTASKIQNSQYNEKYYGTLNIHLNQTEISDEPILIKIVVDESGSMIERAINRSNRTKMEILKITLENMMKYIAGLSKNIWVELSGFNTTVRKYICAKKITPESLNEIIEIINTLKEETMTNLELAIDILQSEYNTVETPEFIHIFGILLTDGEATTGITDADILSQKIQPGTSNHFIALGDNHDAYTMNKLGKATTTTSNWFISNIEYTGNIYGEILYNELHTLLINTTISVKKGKIYDYKINKFVDKLNIGNLSSDTNKNYHIICDNPQDCIVNICGTNIESRAEYKVEASEQPPLEKIDENLLIELEEPYFVEIQYIRLCVQQLLSAARLLHTNAKTLINPMPPKQLYMYNIPQNNNISSEQIDIYEINMNVVKLQNHIHQIMLDKKIEHNKILLGLIDDLKVLYHTNGTEKLMKYGLAREISQATQRANTVEENLELNDNTNVNTNSAYSTPGRSDIMRIISNGINTEEQNINNDIITNEYTNITRYNYQEPSSPNKIQRSYTTNYV